MIKKNIERLGCITIVLTPFVWFFLASWIDKNVVVIKENMPSKDSTSLGFFLPDQAKNISYWCNRLYMYYECEVSEKDALEFASKRKWTMQPIGEEPIRMDCHFFSTTDGPQLSAATEYFEKYGESTVYPYYISEGYYSDSTMNKDEFHIVYDTSLGKLFFRF